MAEESKIEDEIEKRKRFRDRNPLLFLSKNDYDYIEILPTSFVTHSHSPKDNFLSARTEDTDTTQTPNTGAGGPPLKRVRTGTGGQRKIKSYKNKKQRKAKKTKRVNKSHKKNKTKKSRKSHK